MMMFNNLTRDLPDENIVVDVQKLNQGHWKDVVHIWKAEPGQMNRQEETFESLTKKVGLIIFHIVHHDFWA